MENTNGSGGNGKTSPHPSVHIVRQIVRDLSFENFAQQPQGAPEVDVKVNIDAGRAGEVGKYEVALKLNVIAKDKKSSGHIFILELLYSGLFQLQHFPEDQLRPFLLIECPKMLFPFVRRIVSDVTRDGGLPPLNLQIIDFAELYRIEMKRGAAEKKKTASPS